MGQGVGKGLCSRGHVAISFAMVSPEA
jgi:hypothetical protein